MMPGRSFSRELGDVAAAWLATLSAEQCRVAAWPFDVVERGDWHYAPRARAGLALRGMSGPQREAARVLLGRALSVQGLAKADAIMSLEPVLAALERSRGRVRDRDPLNYSCTVFGDPGRPPWGWRIEGHHLSLNFTVARGGAVSVTPSFWGANPARIPHGDREGDRTLGGEYHLGLRLARSLSAGQRGDAVFADEPVGNIVTERGHARDLRHPTGLACDQLGEDQRRLLTALIEEYLGNAPEAAAAPYRRLVLGALGKLRLAWAGGMTEGEPFYYRLHGPRIIVELDCTADDANHIHSVWRDPVNDWGRDILAEHYRVHHDDD